MHFGVGEGQRQARDVADLARIGQLGCHSPSAVGAHLHVAHDHPHVRGRIGDFSVGLGDEVEIGEFLRQFERLGEELAAVREDDVGPVVDVFAHHAVHVGHGHRFGEGDFHPQFILDGRDPQVAERVVVGVGDGAREDRGQLEGLGLLLRRAAAGGEQQGGEQDQQDERALLHLPPSFVSGTCED